MKSHTFNSVALFLTFWVIIFTPRIYPDDYITQNQKYIDVLHYDINIQLNTKLRTINADVKIKGVIKNKDLKRIDLNFYDNFNISDVYLNGEKTTYENKGTRFSILRPPTLVDTFTIRVVYSGKPVRRGFSSFVFASINGQSVVYSLNEPNYASTWFPCNDIPSDKALLDIKITNDSSQVSVSNGKLIDVKTVNNKRTYHWKTYYPIATYLISLYSSNYKEFDQTYISQNKADTMKIKYYAFPYNYKKAKVDFSINLDMLKFMSKTFGEYPFIKEKYGVAEFLWQLGAIEHQTITGIGSSLVGGDNFFNDVYIHELSHQWWGDAVSIKDWKDIWLNEGFATYNEALYDEYKAGPAALRSTMLSKAQNRFSGKLYNPHNYFSRTVYNKGAWVLHMLRREVGDSTFYSILRKYFEKYKYKNVSTNDFKVLSEKISGKNLTYFFKQWVYEGTGRIEAEYNWDVDEDGDDIYLDFQLEQIQKGYKSYNFPLDIKINYKDSSNEIKTIRINNINVEKRIKLKARPINIELDPNNWLLSVFKNNG